MNVRIVILFLFNLFFTFSFAQNKKVFYDSIHGKGELIYSSVLNDSLFPKNGNYELRWFKNHGDFYKTYLIKGKTKNFLPHGKWTWEESEWKYKIDATHTIRPSFELLGSHQSWTGEFVDGKAIGKWIYKVDTILNNGKTTKPSIEIVMNFINNKPIGEFTIKGNEKSSTFTILGKVNKEGLLDGKTSISITENGNNSLEEFMYKNGILLHVILKQKNKTDNFQLSDNIAYYSKKNTNEFTLGDSLFFEHEYKTIGSKLYDNQLQQFINNVWNHPYFPFKPAFQKPGVLRIKYPFQEKELLLIDEIQQLLTNQGEELENYTSKNTVLYSSFSLEIDAVFQQLKQFQQQNKCIDSLIQSTALPYFTYKKRHQHELSSWMKMINSLITENELLKLDENTFLKGGIFVVIQEHLSKKSNLISELKKVIDISEIAMQREDEIKKLESEIVEKMEKLNTLYAGKTFIIQEISAKWIKGKINEEIQAFSTAKEYSLAMKFGNNLLKDMDTLLNWRQKVNDFDSLIPTLKTRYSYKAYNPYTGNYDIVVPIKKKFIANVTEILWPYLIHQLEQEKDFNAWCEKWNQLFEIYRFLNEYVSDESKNGQRLNQKVRKEKKPEKMLKLIEGY